MSWNNFDNSMQNAGGFMDSSMNNSISGGGPGGGGGGNDKSAKRGQNCVPVMICHLLRHGDKLEVWGIPARIVTFVAIVRNLESKSTKVTFEFEDETGSIKGIKWLEGDDAIYESPVGKNTYARVYGLIRGQSDDEQYVLIISVQPLEHANELLTHLMEVTLMCLQGDRMSEKMCNNDTSYANSSIQVTGTNGAAGDTANIAGLTDQQQLVLEIIQNCQEDYGFERDYIKSQVPSHIKSRLDEILDFLSREGHIYTTKTDDFFKAI